MESLGLDLRLLIAQIVNFLIIFIILKKLLYKPILKYLDERKLKIQQSLENTEKINNQLADIEAREKKILQKAEDEAERIICERRKDGEAEKEKIIEEARTKAAQEIQKGVVLAKQEIEKARREFREEAISIGSIMAEKIMEKKLSNEEKHQLIKELTK